MAWPLHSAFAVRSRKKSAYSSGLTEVQRGQSGVEVVMAYVSEAKLSGYLSRFVTAYPGRGTQR
jgi:hypothetical protein